MVSPAVQLASKIPDKSLQVWAVSLLAGTDIMELRHWSLGERGLREVSMWLSCVMHERE